MGGKERKSRSLGDGGAMGEENGSFFRHHWATSGPAVMVTADRGIDSVPDSTCGRTDFAREQLRGGVDARPGRQRRRRWSFLPARGQRH